MLKTNQPKSIRHGFAYLHLQLNFLNTVDRYHQIQKMLEEQPDDEFLHYALALECINRDQISEGIVILEKLREKSPEYLGLYYKLANTYSLTGSHEKAVETYKAGIRLAEDLQDFKTRNELRAALALFEDEDFD